VKTGFSSLTVGLSELVSEQSNIFGFHHECSLKRRLKRTASVPAIFNQKPAHLPQSILISTAMNSLSLYNTIVIKK